MTIKKKIALWFSISLLVIEVIMVSLTFTIGQSVFNTDIQAQLTKQVDANAQEIEFYNSLEGREIEMGDQYLVYEDGFLEIDDDFCNYINGIYTALIDENNNLLYGECPVRLRASQSFTFLKATSFKYKNISYYIYERPLHGDGLEGLWLRGVASQREGASLLYTTMGLVCLLLPALAILSVAGGYLLTRRSLAPMDTLISTAENINGGDDLSQRIILAADHGHDDEVHQLAHTFNNMLDRLEEAFQREKQFTADASHELRTPISVILAQCEYSLELAETKEDYQEALQVIEEQGFKMKELVSQLLFFARMEQGHESLHLSKVNISQLTAKICEEQIALHSVEENNANIQLATDIEPDIISSVDQALFIRLLTNLISNAYQYGKSDGHITVTLACQPANQSSFPVTDSSNLPTYDSAVCLTVSDDGIGIASEHLPYIWNRFYQADPARTASAASNSQGGEAAGAGLGLSMVKAIAAVHGGSAAVDSAPGQGSIFTVTLPLR